MWWGRKLLRVSVYLGDGSLVPLISVSMPRCGVCGGDGNCSGSRYIWEKVPLSRCSASCGTGTRMVRMVCKDVLQGLVVEDGLCLEDTRPDIQIDSCNTNPCPPRLVICFRTFFYIVKLYFVEVFIVKTPFKQFNIRHKF